MDSAQIELDAAAWLARCDSGNWNETDERAFAAWQAQSTAHRIAVIRIQTTWQKADRLQALGAGIARGEIPKPGSWQLPRLSGNDKRTQHIARPAFEAPAFARRIFKPWALVASLLLALCGACIGYFVYREPNIYRSAIGETRVVTLPDRSTLTLNTNSAVRVTLTATERRIDLYNGEVFFEVAQDPQRPLVVNAAGKRIVVVGTRFSVFREPLDVRVVVTEGQVSVAELRDGRAVGPETRLPAGSIARAGAAGVIVKHSTVAEAETYTTWLKGYIALHDTELATAVAEFNRYNKRQLVIADPAIAAMRIGGNLRATNIDAFIRVLEEGFAVRAEDQGNRIVLTGKR